MIGVYFSGTGNTRHCVEYFVGQLSSQALCYSIEDEKVRERIKEHDVIIMGTPVYFSDFPKILRDFIQENGALFQGKKVFVIATMGLFSGDGSGVLARELKKHGAKILGGLHLTMPDCIGDNKLLKKTLRQNQNLIEKAHLKIENGAKKLRNKQPTKEGLGFFSHIAGLLSQRLMFHNITRKYSNKLKVDQGKCSACGVCVKVCPMKNLKIKEKSLAQNGRCTMCYRCINSCPKQALTLLGKRVYHQGTIEKYLKKGE